MQLYGAMRLYAAVEKVEPQDDGTIKVFGICSSEDRDDQGEVVLASAMRDALPEYMKYPALREMHQLQAAGTTLEADVGDDKITRICAHVVDPIATAKVKASVYRGFSIGGKVTKRDTADFKTITGLDLNEISLVDRPANPSAALEMWKVAGAAPEDNMAEITTDPANGVPDTVIAQALAAAQALKAAAAPQDSDGARQGWAASDGSFHKTKADAQRCSDLLKAAAAADTAAKPVLAAFDRLDAALGAAKAGDAPGDGDRPYGDVKYADPGYQADGKKRYPIDSERHIRAAWSYINKPKNGGKYSAEHLASIKSRIVAAWKAKIDKDGPPSADDKEKAAGAAFQKALYDVGSVAHIILRLNALKEALGLEALMEGDESPQPGKLEVMITDMCAFLNALVAEETAELLADKDVQNRPYIPGAPDGYMAPSCFAFASRNPSGAAALSKTLAAIPDEKKVFEKFLADLNAAISKAGAKHSAHDQAMLDLAHHATTKAAGIPGLGAGAMDHLGKAADELKAAGAGGVGAEPSEEDNSTQDTGRNATHPAPQSHPPAPEYHGQNATQDTGRNATSAAPQVNADGTGSGSGIDSVKAVIVDGLAKRHGGHQALMDVAHDCVAECAGGMACGTVGKAGARHSAETMDHLHKAHEHLKAAGANCDKAAVNPVPGDKPTADGEAEGQGTEFEAGKAAGVAMAKLSGELAAERAEKTALLKTLSDMAPRLDQLSKRVEEIAAQPMPPLTAAREVVIPPGLTSVSKAADGGGTAAEAEITKAAMIEAFGKMSKEDQTLVLIKASYANPMPVPGSGTRLG